MDQLFYYLNFKGINIENISQPIFNMNNNELEDLIHEINSAIYLDSTNFIKQKPIENINYRFTSNAELYGETVTCGRFECRIKRINELAKFAILYSDIVVIENYFYKYKQYKRLDLEHIKQEIADDLEILYYIRPLLDSRLFVFGISRAHYCTNCLKEFIAPFEIFENKLKLIDEYINETLIDNVEVTYLIDGNEPTFYVKASEDYITHSFTVGLLPEFINNVLSNIIDTSKNRKLTKNELLSSQFINYISYPLLNDILDQNWRSNIYKTNYVTNRKLDFDVLKVINNEPLNEINKNLFDNITHSVPFIYNADMTKLLELRETEKESFSVYRNSLNKVIKSCDLTNENIVKEAFNDFVNPQLDRINMLVKNSKDKLISAIKTDTIIGSALVTLGLFTGVINPQLSAIITTLGGFNYARQIGSKISEIFNVPSDIKNNECYFLWRVSKL